MSKAIAGAAMLAGAASLFFIPGLNVLFTPLLMHLMISLAAGGLAMEAGAIAEALTSNRGQNITTRMVAGLRQIILGMQRVGGTVIYQSTTGSHSNQYNYVIVFATHEIDAYVNLYLDGRQVFWKQDGNAANIGCGAVSDPAVVTASIYAGAVTGLALISGGSGYANVAPTKARVRIYGGGGQGAWAWATIAGGTCTAVTLTLGGSGYTSPPEVEVQGAYTFGGNAAADEQDPAEPGHGKGYGIGPGGPHYNFDGKVFCHPYFGDQLDGTICLDLTANDPAWNGNPFSPFTAKGGATFNTGLTGEIDAITVSDGGQYYTDSTDAFISITDPTGSGADAVATVVAGVVTAVTVISGGVGYTNPTVTFAPPSGGPPGTSGTMPWVGGCAYLYVKVEYDPALFPSPPEIRATINGKNNIWDPRTGKRTFTSNWALIVADEIEDPVLGLGDVDSVNIDQLIAAANVCDEASPTSQGDESRYRLDIHFDTATSPGDALALMMPAAAGRLSRIGGEWFIWPAYYQGPSFTFDESALVDTIQWTPYRSFKDLFNRVNGTFIAPNFPYSCAGNLYDKNGWFYGETEDRWPLAWQPTNYPQYAQDARHGYSADQWLIEDGGVQLPKEVTHRGVISIVQAQRVGKIMLLRNRFQGSGSFPMQLAAWQMQSVDVMQFSFAKLGWANKLLEIDGAPMICEESKGGQGEEGGDEATLKLYCQVNVIETDPTIYEWSPSEELTPYDIAAGGTQMPYTPAAPMLLTLRSDAGTALIAPDGTATPRVLVSWTAPLDISVITVDVQYKLHADATWIDDGPVNVGLFETFVSGVVAGQAYDFRIRGMRANGAASAWVEIDNFTTGIVISSTNYGAVAPAGTLIAATISLSVSNIIVNPFTAKIPGFSVSCLAAGSYLLTGLSPQLMYFVYYIDAAFAGGAIVPIATLDQADFVGKPGYFLIGSILTPPFAGVQYRPSNFLSLGPIAVNSPANAYDGDLATLSIVYGVNNGYWVGGAWGEALYEDFPAVTSGAGQSLYVNADATQYYSLGVPWAITAKIGGGQKPSGQLGTFNNRGAWSAAATYAPWDTFTSGGITYLVVAGYTSGGSFGATDIANTCVVLASGTGTAARQTYSVALPVGLDLSTIAVDMTVNAPPAPAGADPAETLWLQTYEIYAR